MLGLRTQENNKFIKFFKLVQDEASKANKVFFLDFGECKDIDFMDMEVDSLFGWLIPKEMVDKFKEKFEKEKDLSGWDDYCVWVITEMKDNKLKILFK